MAQDNHVALVNALSKWIEEHLGRVIHLEELAAYSGYSLWHMQKIFKEVTGISLGKYIRQRRLAGAVNLLRNSSQSIFDIALDFGFGSQSHFTYMFRKEYGITPFDFRQNDQIQLDIKEPLHLTTDDEWICFTRINRP
nr:helix-turn-helix domain-containing protein [Providencia alcalifaciens]